MSLVLDSSATLARCFIDEVTPAIIELFDRVKKEGAVVPAIWRLEVANGLQVGIKRKRLNAEQRDQLLETLAEFDISTDPETDRYAWSGTLHLADRFGLTLYDASYLELAQRLNVSLATLDQDLRSAARSLQLKLLAQ